MRRVLRTIVAALATSGALAAASLSFAGPALAAEDWGALGAFGSPGSGAGQLLEPSGVAVNEATGDVYVVDKGNKRVEEFAADGAFVKEFTPPGGFEEPKEVAVDSSGKSVSEDPSVGDVYVTDEARKVVDKFSSTGVYIGQITGTCPPKGTCAAAEIIPFIELDGVAVDSNGVVRVESSEVNGYGEPAIDSFSGEQPNAFLSSHTSQAGVSTVGGLAVDSEDNLYVIYHGGSGVTKLNSAGEAPEEEGRKNLGGLAGASGVAVSSANNDAYIDTGASVAVISPAELLVESFGGGLLNQAGSVAVDPTAGPGGHVYVAEPVDNEVLILEHSETPPPPPPIPVTEKVEEITTTSARFTGTLNPENTAGGVGYYFSYNSGSGATCNGPGSVNTRLNNGGANLTGNSPVSVSAVVTTLDPGGEYVVCLVAYRFGATAGLPEPFKTLSAAPEVISESLVSTSAEEGALSAVINPENEETTYHFEYATNGSVAKNELKFPHTAPEVEPFPVLPPGFVPNGETVTVSNVVLNRELTLYYRVVATNTNGGMTKGPVQEYTKAPLVEGESVSGVTMTGALLEAKINPDFMSGTAYVFEYAVSEELLDKSDGTAIGGGSLPETVNKQFPVSVEIAGLQSGETYYYRAVAKNEIYVSDGNEKAIANGPIQHFKTPARPDAMTIAGAQDITRTNATLSGTVNPEGVETTYSFQYISETAYQAALAKHVADAYTEGETTVPVSAGSGEAAVAAGPTLANGLRPGETYHYRLVATNRFGARSIGEEHTFTTTTATPPLASTGGASNISQNTATLAGTVTTNGLQTNYGFEIGTEPGNYGPPTGLGSIGGAQTEEVHVTLGELQPGTTYYYRVTATNADGTVRGLPVSFATPGFPVLLVPTASLPLIPNPSVVFPAEESASGVSTKGLTNKQKLARALKACHAKKGKKRTSCEAAAHRKYGAAKKKRKK